jgi:hypothetical protein
VTATEDFVDRPRQLTPAGRPVPGRTPAWLPEGRRADLVVAGAYLAAALYVTSSLWTGIRDRVVAGYGTQDQVLMEWFLGHAARALTHLQNPMYSHQLDAPWGVNMMAQTNVLGLGLPMTPVTLLFGPRVSFVTLVVLALAGTAFAWYYVLSRYVVKARWAAFAGGAFCGFAPGMISESLGHLHMISQFLIPFVALQVLRLGREGRWWRHGLVLGLLLVYQAMISEEMLFFTGLSVGLFIVVYVIQRPPSLDTVKRFAGGAGTALAVAGVILALPLYKQFFGGQHYRGLPFSPSLIFVDLASYSAFPSNSFAGNVGTAQRLAHTTAEETSFFGWPLVLVVLALAVWLSWRKLVLARTAAITGLIFALLSLGYTVMVDGRATVPGPFRLISHLPLVDLVVAARLALVVIPFVGILLAIGLDQSVTLARPWLRYLVPAAVALACLPIVPLPVPTVSVPAVPHFITAGTWRGYVPGDRTLVPVPTPSSFALDGMRWAAAARLDFAIPRGYFLGPGETPRSAPLYGAVPTWTSIILDQVATSGDPYIARPDDDTYFRADLRLWKAGVLVLDTKQPHADALRTTVEQFLGPAQRVDDVWLWDVRGLPVR